MLISVIVACYNVDTYIEEAVRSVMNQTHKDLEIICVNDASTDATLSILHKLQMEDGRIKIVSLENNRGLFFVRKKGIDQAKGDYITFLDGDDLLTPEILAHAIHQSIRLKTDIVHFIIKPFAVEQISPEHLENLERTMHPSSKRFSVKQGALVEECFVRREFCWNLCGKLFRADIIKKGFQQASSERITMAEDLWGAFPHWSLPRGNQV